MLNSEGLSKDMCATIVKFEYNNQSNSNVAIDIMRGCSMAVFLTVGYCVKINDCQVYLSGKGTSVK